MGARMVRSEPERVVKAEPERVKSEAERAMKSEAERVMKNATERVIKSAAERAIKGAAERAIKRNPERALTEVIEEAGVTQLRNEFLQAIERLQENPALRFVIRKHGRQQAVLLSAEAYGALRALVDRVVQHADAMNPGDRLERAFLRLEEDRAAKTAEPPEMAAAAAAGAKDARALLAEMQLKMRELETALGSQQAVDEANMTV